MSARRPSPPHLGYEWSCLTDKEQFQLRTWFESEERKAMSIGERPAVQVVLDDLSQLSDDIDGSPIVLGGRTYWLHTTQQVQAWLRRLSTAYTEAGNRWDPWSDDEETPNT